MPLAWFSDPVKVTVSLCSKTLWDERNPNWIETLICNCLIPFCLIQEKERERESEAQTAQETHLWYSLMRLTDVELNIPDDAVGCSDWVRPLLFFFYYLCIIFLYCHRWDKSAHGFCCLHAHRWSVLSDPDVPSLFYTEPVIVYANKTSLPGDPCQWTNGALWKYVFWYSGMRKGNHPQYLCLYLFTAHIKRWCREKNAAVLPRTSQWFHFFFLLLWLFCPLHKD